IIPSVAPSQINLPTTAPRTTLESLAAPALPAANITSSSSFSAGEPPLSNALDASQPRQTAPKQTKRIDWRKPIKAAGLVMAALVLLGGGGYVISQLFFKTTTKTDGTQASI